MIALNPRLPLPVAWQGMQNQLDRRTKAGHLQICNNSLDRFNNVLEVTDPQRRHLSADQVATTARLILSEHNGLPIPVSIYERLRCMAAMNAMFKELDWEIEEVAAWRSATLLEYFKSREVLFPNNAPVVGYLDDAILMEASWPELSGEVGNFYDYRRLRRIEADGRGKEESRFRFTRRDWLECREIENRLQAQVRRTGLGSFIESRSAPMFWIH